MSEVKVNKISPRTNCGTVTVGDSGDSVSVSAGVPVTVNGDLKSNALKATDGGVIISQSGTNITLGASGDTVTLASGASQSGFGREGSVNWQTDSIKTSTFTATSGEGYFCNTSGGAFTVNLPAGSAGAIVSVADYTRTFNDNNLTISPNGSEKIGGYASDAKLNVNGQSATFIYVDATEGWVNVQETQTSQTGIPPYIVATGGTISTSGNDKIHTFTGPGTFTVCAVAGTCGPTRNIVSYIVVAGGGGGGPSHGGGGGAGGYREDKSPVTTYTASPLDGAPTITVTKTSFPIAVGSGGSAGKNAGSSSTFSTITSAGGGGGGYESPGSAPSGQSGGSGGGGGSNGSTPGGGGSGNSPPVSPAQGKAGGPGAGAPGSYRGGGGGGGATACGASGSAAGGNGGAGATTEISGSPVARAGGGGGGSYNSTQGSGGTGGGGTSPAGAGTANTGGGGASCGSGGAGGSGVVIIRYRYQ